MQFIADMTGKNLVSKLKNCYHVGVASSNPKFHRRKGAHGHVEEVERYMSPVRDLFSIIFFATIGFHVFPTFVFVEFTILLWMTFVVVSTKFAIR